MNVFRNFVDRTSIYFQQNEIYVNIFILPNKKGLALPLSPFYIIHRRMPVEYSEMPNGYRERQYK